jgi:Fe-S-cluster containining protein
MADMDRVHARQADTLTLVRAGMRARLIGTRIDAAAQVKLAERAKSATSKQAKVMLLHQLADTLGAATVGIVPCKRGCNHCCHMATLVSIEEAEVIARQTGARLSVPAQYNQFGEDMVKKHFGVACTFLTADGCSIYAHRPFACRVHYSVDEDNLLCEMVPGETIRAPTMNVNGYDAAFVAAFGGALRMQYADIRDFFVPQGGGGGVRRDADEPRAGGKGTAG